MDEMKVYIVNLGKYVEGEDAGAWFTLPVDKDVVAERLGLDSRYEEIAIHDYELPFQIGEYESLDELNRLAGLIEDLPDDVQANLSDLIDEFGSVDDVAEAAQDLSIMWVIPSKMWQENLLKIQGRLMGCRKISDIILIMKPMQGI